MTERVELPSGGWVELRDPKTLKRGDRKRILQQVAADTSGDGSAAAAGMPSPLAFGIDVTDALAVAMIENWEVPYLPNAPVPVPPGLLDRLTLEDSDAVDNALTPAARLLFPKPADPGQHADPASPSGPASA